MRSGDRGEVEMISRYSHDVLLNPDGVSRSPRLPPTKLLNLSCDCRCYTMSSKCDGFSEVPVLAISRVVDTSGSVAISGVVDTSSTSSGCPRPKINWEKQVWVEVWWR